MKFSELNLEDSVLQALDAMNFRECTPVQEHTIPVILEGKDYRCSTNRNRKNGSLSVAGHKRTE